MNYFCGIDLGSSYAKAVIINDNGQMMASSISKTGIHFDQMAQILFAKALKKANLKPEEIRATVSTGVGRNNCGFATFSKPEIGCFAKGSFFLCGGPAIVIDIGGQDNKVIKLDEKGRQIFFRMNRKCAAGTGSFLEEIAMKLDLDVDEMNQMAEKATTCVAISSFCTVFAGTEVIHHLRVGDNTEELIRGVFDSVVKRVLEMATLDEKIILTGGAIAKNPVLTTLFKEHVKLPIEIPANPQLVGALGAALYAKAIK